MESRPARSDPDDARRSPRASARWLAGLARGGGPHVALAIAAPLAAGVLLLIQAYLLAGALDAAIDRGASRDILLPAMLGIGALIAARAVLSFAGERSGSIAAELIMQRVRGALFRDLLSRRPDWAGARSSGALSAAVVDQVDALEGYFARFVPAMVQAAVLPLMFAVVILPFDWVAALLFLLTAPLIPVFMALAGWGAEAAKNAQATAFARLSGYFSDRLRGLLALKLFGREEAEIEAARRAGEALRLRTMRVLGIAFLSSAVLEFFAALGVAGVALYAGLTYLGMLDLGTAPLSLKVGLFCLLMAPEVYQPLRLLAAHYHDRAGAKAAVAAIAAEFEALPEVAGQAPASPSSSLQADRPAGGFAVRGLTARVPGGKRIVLDRLDLDVARGEHVAILGPSGCGKSTLLECLAGLRDHDGSVSLGGADLAALDDGTVRRAVALVPQRPWLFAGSIADNIRLGRPEASDAEVADAARLALVTAFSGRLPGGLGARIGEGGAGLSGGEAHRVALARLFLRDPSLILLDEPTAHLDAASEAEVLDGIAGFARGRGLIVATHSLAVAARMDRAFRLGDGRLLPLLLRRPAAPALEGAA